MDNNKPDAKVSSEPEAVAPPAGQPAPAAPSDSSSQPRTSTQSRRAQQPAETAETRRRREEEHHGYSQGVPRPRFEDEHKSTPHLNPRGAEFESIRLATRIEEWYRDHAREEKLTEPPAQKGNTLLFSENERAVQPSYLYHPDKDDTDLIDLEYRLYEPPRRRSIGHIPWRKSYTNTIPKTRDYAATLVHKVIITTNATRHHSSNIYCIEKTEDDGDAYSKIPEMS